MTVTIPWYITILIFVLVVYEIVKNAITLHQYIECEKLKRQKKPPDDYFHEMLMTKEAQQVERK